MDTATCQIFPSIAAHVLEATTAEIRYDRSECHYGQPVLVVDGAAMGPGDLPSGSIIGRAGLHADALEAAGYRVVRPELPAGAL